MYLLALLTVIGSALALPVIENNEKNTVLESLYVLPRDTIPLFYDVSLILDPDNEAYFNGTVAIRILPYVSTSQIVIHAMELEIKTVGVYSDRTPANDIYLDHEQSTDDTHLLRINLKSPLPVLQPHTINIKYSGKYAPNMFGIYVSTYETNNQPQKVITSQLQPTFARRAFPCYDEPALKAKFSTTIYAPPTYPVVRSNMPLKPASENVKEDIAGYTKHEFADTLTMSTYLLAYLVSNFEYIENQQNDIYHIPFRVYSRPGTQTGAEFALRFGQENMVALEKYVDFAYAFPKIDKAAVPDFAAGAMENWGLVVYREVALLVTEGVTTTSVKQNVGRIICHENVHMWFGNEVGPLSWTYTWLNEGFANFFENFATDLVRPDWRMMDQFVLMMQNVFQSDAVISVNPMTHPVYTPSQILGTFNAVAYQKSGSVIRMMQHFLTPEVFRQGLILYIKDKSRSAAHPSDLYTSLQKALDASTHSIPFPLATVMTRWTTQGGFPVLTVTRSAAAAQSIVVAQERYLTDRSNPSNDRWHVPINWVLSTDPDFSDTSPQAWVPPAFPARSFDIPGLSNAEWYIINKQQTGYYRVNYDLQNWIALGRVFNSNHSLINVLNRAQVIDDAFNLARNGRLNYEHAFEISRYLEKEKNYIPWGAANPAFTYLDGVLSGTGVYNLFQQYLLALSAPLFEELGFLAGDEEFVTAYHRNIILDLNCRHGNPNCINTAQELLEGFREGTTQLNADIQTLVFCSGLRGGSVENFNFLWNRYVDSSDSSEQSILLNALGCTSNVERRAFYLGQVIDDNSPVREQDRHTVIVSVTNASPESTEAALDFVVANFAEIQPRVQGLTGTTNILNAFARRLTTEAHLEKVRDFEKRYEDIFSAGEIAAIAGINENIAASVTWTKDNAAVVEAWLRSNYGSSGAPMLVSSLIVLISAFVTIFNY